MEENSGYPRNQQLHLRTRRLVPSKEKARLLPEFSKPSRLTCTFVQQTCRACLVMQHNVVGVPIEALRISPSDSTFNRKNPGEYAAAKVAYCNTARQAMPALLQLAKGERQWPIRPRFDRALP